MEKTWKPTTAGILSIIAGASNLIVGLPLAVVGVAAFLFGFAAIAAVPFLVLGVIAIIGGIYALRRQAWGLALAGSICSIISLGFILGILATIFVSLGKTEFK
jgi:hypothetical protein